MNEQDRQIETLWERLHNRPDASNGETPATPPDREVRAESRNLDRALRALVPKLDLTSDRLADEILAEIEREERAAAQPALHVLPQRDELPGIWALLAAPLFQRWSSGLAAAAAALFILAGIPYYLGGAVRWAQPEFAETALRGGEPGETVYTREDAAACLGALKRAIQNHLYEGPQTRLHLALRNDEPLPELAFRFEAIQGPALLVTVEIRDADGTVVRRWRERESNVADFLEQADRLGTQIAALLKRQA